MGRRPLPNWKKELSGSRRFNAAAPAPGAPADLSVPRGLLTPTAKRFWNDNLPQLVEMGIVTEADLPAFTLMAQSWGFAQEAAGLVRKGLLIPDKKGSVKRNPAWMEWRDAATMFMRIASTFGLTPDTRSRLNITPIDEGEDELMRLLFQRAAQGD